jgi:hypothetical protein
MTEPLDGRLSWKKRASLGALGSTAKRNLKRPQPENETYLK